MADAVPVQEHALRLQVQFLDAAVDHLVTVDDDVADGRHQRRAARCQEELVDVREDVADGTHDHQRAVRRVGNGVPRSDARPVWTLPPPGQHRVSVVSLHAQISDAARVKRPEPDEPAAVVEDHRSGRSGGLTLRRDEDEAGIGLARGMQNSDDRRLQIRP